MGQPFDVNKIAEAAAEKAIERYRCMRQQMRCDTQKQYIDLTKYVLRKYRTIKANAEAGIDSIDWDLGNRIETVHLNEVTARNLRDMTMLAYIDRKLDLFRYYCQTSPKEHEQRRWDVINMMYIEPFIYDKNGIRVDISVEYLAEFFDKDRSTIFEDLKWSYAEISSLLWGMAL